MWCIQEITLTTKHIFPVVVVCAAEYLFDHRQENRKTAVDVSSIKIIHETGLALGHVVLTGYLRYRSLMTKNLPEVQFKYPLVPMITVHTMNVLLGYRCES